MKRLIFYAGLPKTGSKSWAFALEQLGWKSIHNWIHNNDAFSRYDWDWFRENPDGHVAFFDGLAGRYQKLHELFPEALFISSIKSAEEIAWSHWRHAQANVVTGIHTAGDGWLRWERMRRRALHYHDDLLTFFSHPSRIQNLHVQRLDEGWSPICELLGVPVPEVPFPHKNVSSKLRTQTVDERDPGPQSVR